MRIFLGATTHQTVVKREVWCEFIQLKSNAAPATVIEKTDANAIGSNSEKAIPNCSSARIPAWKIDDFFVINRLRRAIGREFFSVYKRCLAIA
jgi:hypothetical protein